MSIEDYDPNDCEYASMYEKYMLTRTEDAEYVDKREVKDK